LTRRKLAQLAHIDPSYVTLIERYGYVPRRNKVLDLARALKIDSDSTLIMAGYAPQDLPLQEFMERIEIISTEKFIHRELRDVVRELHTLPESEQKRAATMLGELLSEARMRGETQKV